MFAPVQLLRKSSEQWPGNQGDFDLSVTGVDLLLISALYSSAWLLGCVLTGSLCTNVHISSSFDICNNENISVLIWINTH